MNTTDTVAADYLEIRILSGDQQDACCQIQDGDSIGSDTGCDIVLAGCPEMAAQLHCSSLGWQILADSGNALIALTAIGKARMLGTFWITVAWHSSAWTLEAATDEIDETAESGEPVILDLPFAGPPPGVVQGRLPALGLRLAVASLTLFALISLVWYSWSDAPPPGDAATPETDAQLAFARAQQTISQLGLAERVKVVAVPNGSLQLNGWLRDRAEQQRLIAAMAAIRPRPLINLTVHTDIPRVLAGLLPHHAIAYRPDYSTEGQLLIHGISHDAAQRAALLDSVRERLPGIRILGQDILLAADVQTGLNKELSAAGLPALPAIWQERELRLDASSLSQGDSEKLGTLVKQFNQRHFGVARISTEAAPATLPFAVRSVVSGPAPFVVLGDGSRLFEGGWHQKFRLNAIEENRLIFDRPRSLILPR